MAISEKRIDELEYEAINLRETILIRDQTINGLLNMNDRLAEENAELKRQIEVFTKAEIWGDDAAKYEGEYNGK